MGYDGAAGQSLAQCGQARWRRLDQGLWVGHDGDHALGTIEQGRRFTWIDADGEPHPGYADLQAAQAAAGRPAQPGPDDPARPFTWSLAVATSAVVAIGTVAWAVVRVQELLLL